MIITLEQGWAYMEDAQKFPTSIICMPTSFVIMHISPAFLDNQLSSHSTCLLHLYHALQHSAYEFLPDKHS